MKNKIIKKIEDAIFDINDGATVMVGGFAARGTPSNLLIALRDKGVKNLTVIRNDSSGGWKNPIDVNILVENNQVAKVITAFPAFGSPKKVSSVEQKVLEGKCVVELVPMGTFVERIRAGGAGIGAFYTPTGVGTEIAKGKEIKKINGREMLLEFALKADFSLIKAYKSDKMGNLIYRMSARNFNPIMAMASYVTIVETERLLETGEIDADNVHTPCIFVDRIVHCPKEKK